MAVDLTGDADYITISDQADFTFGDGSDDIPFSISAWVNMDDSTFFDIICKDDHDTSNNREWIFRTTVSDRLALFLIDNSVGSFLGRDSDANLASYQNTWTHVGVTYDGSNADTGITLYVNGLSVASSANSGGGEYGGMEDKAYPVNIGALVPAGKFANGEICEVALWRNKELSSADMYQLFLAKLYRMPLQLYKSDLVLYLPLDDLPNGHIGINNDTFIDLSGKNYHGTGVDADNDSIATNNATLSYP